MTTTSDKLSSEAARILGIGWKTRNGQVVPATTDVGDTEAELLDATCLYADMANSSEAAHKLKKRGHGV